MKELEKEKGRLMSNTMTLKRIGFASSSAANGSNPRGSLVAQTVAVVNRDPLGIGDTDTLSRMSSPRKTQVIISGTGLNM